MTNELKPCPFCGSAASLKFHESSTVTVFDAVVSCDEGCCEQNADYPWDGDRVAAAERAIAMWNRRAPPPIAGVTPSVEECERAYHTAKIRSVEVDSKHPGRPALLAGISAVRDLCLAQAAERKDASETAFVELLDTIYKHDRTKTYEYGEPLRNGTKPGPGKRFLTPRELIEVHRVAASRSTIAKEGNTDD